MNITTARKKFKYATQDDLIKIICKLSSFSEQADQWLYDNCDQYGEEDDLTDLEKQITKEWNDVKKTISAAEKGRCSDERIYKACRKLDNIPVLAAKGPVSWEFRKKLIDEIIDEYPPSGLPFDDYLDPCAYDLCFEKEEKLYLAEKAGDKELEARIRLEYGDDEAYVNYMSQNLNHVTDYLAFADYFKEQGDEDKAVKVLEEAVEKAAVSDMPAIEAVYDKLFKEYSKNNQEEKILKLYGKVCAMGKGMEKMTLLMYDYYKDDYEKRKIYLLKMLDVCEPYRFKDWFEECQKQLSPEDLSENSDYLHKVLKKQDLPGYLKLRVEEGELQEVFEYLKNNRNDMYDGTARHDLEKKVVSVNPKEVIDWFWEECENLSGHYNTEGFYVSAVNILKEIKSLSKTYGFEKEWESRYKVYLKKHRKQKILGQLLQDESEL